ncbi:SufS family cysteine desulfurase, partial [Candidatus Gottesmanbacteria bacterium]|nr:SufS family cysteine desulfurase [Candidatus Gottesmanbacteria bacterium]
MLDVQKIRKDFPILKREIDGKPIIYLDSTASSLKLRQVLEAMDEYYTQYGINIFRGIYKLSQEATDEYENSRKKVAKFIGAKNENEVIFVRNATEAINLVTYAWGRINIDQNSEIISTVMEHHANIVTWQQLALETGAMIKYLDINEEGKLPKPKTISHQLSAKSKLLAITHVSNVLGTINPIKEIIKEVKRINPSCLVLVDGAQAVPHMKVDVQDLGCDFYAFSGHKMLGPMGIGVLWGRSGILEKMLPFQLGVEMIREVYLEKTVFAEPPAKFEAGTPNVAGAIGLGAAIDYLEKIGMDEVRKHEEELVEYAIGQLSKISNIEIYGPKNPKDRGGVVAFNVKGIHAHDLAQVLDEDNICIRSGHHCAMP